MASDFERAAVGRLIQQAGDLGLGDQVPEKLRELVAGDGPSVGGALIWVRLNPDNDGADYAGCCVGEGFRGPEYCTCWKPIFDVDQQELRAPSSPDDLGARTSMCGDCAYRKDSPERAEQHSDEFLMDLVVDGTPFWCHEGMRRPVRWEHPDGRTVPGDPADYQPPRIVGIPYRADGRPGLLCAGWAHRSDRASQRLVEG